MYTVFVSKFLAGRNKNVKKNPPVRTPRTTNTGGRRAKRARAREDKPDDDSARKVFDVNNCFRVASRDGTLRNTLWQIVTTISYGRPTSRDCRRLFRVFRHETGLVGNEYVVCRRNLVGHTDRNNCSASCSRERNRTHTTRPNAALDEIQFVRYE